MDSNSWTFNKGEQTDFRLRIVCIPACEMSTAAEEGLYVLVMSL